VGGAGWIETLQRRGYRYIGPPVVPANLTLSPRSLHRLLSCQSNRPSSCSRHQPRDDPEQSLFTDGMVDDIITGLSRIKWLFVIGRRYDLLLQGTSVDPRLVGQEPACVYLLCGKRPQGRRSRPRHCQLVDAKSGAQVWSERYDRKLDDVFALQDEIAASVVAAMEPGLQRAEIERSGVRGRTASMHTNSCSKAQPDVDSGMPEQVTRRTSIP